MGFARIAAMLVGGLGALCAVASETSDALRPYSQDVALWGTPSRIVRPDYPKAALRDGQKGAVVVEGIIEGTGALSGLVYKPQSPEAEVFVPALQAVVPYWLFYVPTGNDCMPKPEKVTARAEFEIEGGEPRIFVSYSKRPAEPKHKVIEGYDYRAIRVIKPAYPRRMLYAGLEARVYTRVDVTPSGKVAAVAAMAFSSPDIPKKQQVKETGSRLATEVEVLHDFEEEARQALVQYEYRPSPQGWRGCYTLLFKIRD